MPDVARIRSVKPEFFTSLSVADLTVTARLTWIGLWTHVDDEGRCEADPRLIKAALWPLDDDMTAGAVDAVIDELAAAGKVVRYAVSGRNYLQVTGWHHQKIDRRSESKHPGPDQQDRALAEPSPNDRRADVEPSSPDRDQGSMDRGSMDRDRARVVEPRALVELLEPNGAVALRRDCTAVLDEANARSPQPVLSHERKALRGCIEEALSKGYDAGDIAQAVADSPFRTPNGVMGQLRKGKQPSSVGDRGFSHAIQSFLGSES